MPLSTSTMSWETEQFLIQACLRTILLLSSQRFARCHKRPNWTLWICHWNSGTSFYWKIMWPWERWGTPWSTSPAVWSCCTLPLIGKSHGEDPGCLDLGLNWQASSSGYCMIFYLPEKDRVESTKQQQTPADYACQILLMTLHTPSSIVLSTGNLEWLLF